MKQLLIGLTILLSFSASAGLLSKTENVSGVICEYAETHELAYQNLNGRLSAGNIEVNSISKDDRGLTYSSTPITKLKSVSAPSFSYIYKALENKEMHSACVTVLGTRTN